MSNSVAALGSGNAAMPPRAHASEFILYAANGARKYLNQPERQRFLAALAALPPAQRLFCLALAWTGARVSEVLALKPTSFQIDQGLVSIWTLKRRKPHMREVPLPPEVMSALERHFRVSLRQQDPRAADSRLWPWHRVTAWRLVKQVMMLAQIVGRQASPRGLRHGFGVGTLQSGVPLNLTQRWMGHAKMSTTAIYADARGPEERMIATRFWNFS